MKRLSAAALLAQCATAGSLLVSGSTSASDNVLIALNASTGAHTGTFATAPGNSAFDFGLATMPNGDVLAVNYNSTTGNSTVLRYTANGDPLGIFAQPTGFVDDVTTAPDGTVYTLNCYSGNCTQVQKFNGTTGASEGTVISAAFDFSDVAIAPNGNILTDVNGGLWVYSSSGAFLGAVTGAPLGFGLAVASNGDVFLGTAGSDYSAPGRIYKCAGCQTGSGTMTLFGTDPNTGDLNNLAIGPDGNLYAVSRFADTVLKFDGTSGAYDGIFASGMSWNASDLTFISGDAPFGSTPEPGTIAAAAGGLLALAGLRRKRSPHATWF